LQKILPLPNDGRNVMYILSAIFLFCLTLLLHLMIWRVKMPARGMMAFLRLSVGVFCVGTAALYGFSRFSVISTFFLPLDMVDFFYFLLFFFSLVAAYIMTYSAIEADSPSLAIMLAIVACSDGLTRVQLDRAMSNEILIEPRLKDLVNDKLATYKNGKYTITARGLNFIGIFIAYRNYLKLPKGG